jgi:TolB-like protein
LTSITKPSKKKNVSRPSAAFVLSMEDFMFKRLFLLLVAVLAWATPLWAKTFAVLPFAVHGPKEYQYLSQGIPSMLASRLARPGALDAVDASRVRAAAPTAPTDATAAAAIAKKLGVDYLVWGATTIMGDSCSLDVQLMDAHGAATPFAMETPLSGVIPALEGIATRMDAHIHGHALPPAATTAVAAPNPSIIVNESQPGVYANPSLKYQNADTTQGRWRSQALPFASRGMVVADADGDGASEVFIVTDGALLAYRVTSGELRKVAETQYPGRLEVLRISAFDLERDGKTDIILTGMDGKAAFSTIYTLKGGALQVKEDHIPFFLATLNLPPDFTPTLVGQKIGTTRFLESQVNTVVRSGGSLTLGPPVALPADGNLFNVQFLPDEGSHKVILVDGSDKLRVYSPAGSLLAVTDETYAGSNIAIDKQEAAPGLRPYTENDMPLAALFIPMRMLLTNLDRDKRFELLVGRGLSVSAQIFSNYRDYPQGEMHSLYWDGVGLALQWKTSVIKGTITDYALADLDGDGRLDLTVLVNTHTGLLGTRSKRTVLLAYPLDTSGVSAAAQGQ